MIGDDVKDHTANANYQEIAAAFSPGDIVTIFGMSKDLAGRVVAVWPAIGMVDVEYPSGTRRLPVEDLQRFDGSGNPVPPSTGYVPGGQITTPVSAGPFGALAVALRVATTSPSVIRLASYDQTSYEILRTASKVYRTASRPTSTMIEARDALHLVKVACDCTKGEDPQEDGLIEGISEAVRRLFVANELHGLPVRLASRIQKSAIYWAGKDRKYKPKKSELDSGIYTCPKCVGVPLRKAIYRRRRGRSELLYGCPSCMFLIERRAILTKGGRC